MDKENRIWCVYKHTNLVNNKVYIGKTCRKPEYRWNEGKGYRYQSHFWHSIQKYGWHNFLHEIIQANLTSDEASDLEKTLIKHYNSIDPNHGYNQTAGGEGMLGWHHTEESLEKIRKSNSTRGVSEKTRQKMRAIMKEKYKDGNTPFRGKKHKQSTKAEISRLSVERWKNEEYRSKMMVIMRSEERNRKISDKKKELWNDPEYRRQMVEYASSEENKKRVSEFFKGRKHTAEELRKMSEGNSGERNGMYGKHGKDNPCSKPVIQYSIDGMKIAEYDGAMEACLVTGIDNASIGKCCNHNAITAGGYIWRYPGDDDIELPRIFKENNSPVYQFDINANLIAEYKNVDEAALVNGFNKYKILEVCRNNLKSTSGYIWSFERNVEPRLINRSNSKVVLMFTVGGEWVDEFESVTHAGKKTGIDESSIIRCCKGKQRSAGDYLFLYDEDLSDEELYKRVDAYRNRFSKKKNMII